MIDNLIRFNKNVRYAVCDFETFNLNLSFQMNRPWQFGCVEVIGEQIIETHDIHINWPDAPHLKIGKEAALVTKYNHPYHMSVAIDAKLAFDKILPILQNADKIIFHNGLNFDLYLLRDWWKMEGAPWKWILDKFIDTNAIARGIKLNIPYDPKDNFLEYQYRMARMVVKGCKTNLTALGKEYGFEFDPEKLHEAIEDVKLNLKVWNKLKHQIEY